MLSKNVYDHKDATICKVLVCCIAKWDINREIDLILVRIINLWVRILATKSIRNKKVKHWVVFLFLVRFKQNKYKAAYFYISKQTEKKNRVQFKPEKTFRHNCKAKWWCGCCLVKAAHDAMYVSSGHNERHEGHDSSRKYLLGTHVPSSHHPR